MDGENNGTPYFLMDDLGGVIPPFKETPISSAIFQVPSRWHPVRHLPASVALLLGLFWSGLGGVWYSREPHFLVKISKRNDLFLVIQSVPFLGWLSDPFKWLSDLQLGYEKVTLNHLVENIIPEIVTNTNQKNINLNHEALFFASILTTHFKHCLPCFSLIHRFHPQKSQKCRQGISEGPTLGDNANDPNLSNSTHYEKHDPNEWRTFPHKTPMNHRCPPPFLREKNLGDFQIGQRDSVGPCDFVHLGPW